MKKVIISLMAVLVPLIVCAEVLVDYSNGRTPAVGPASIETSGTNTVLKVNSVVSTNSTVTKVNATTISAYTSTIVTNNSTVLNITGAAGTAGNVAGLLTNGVASMTADATWLPIQYGGTNYWMPAFKKN